MSAVVVLLLIVAGLVAWRIVASHRPPEPTLEGLGNTDLRVFTLCAPGDADGGRAYTTVRFTDGVAEDPASGERTRLVSVTPAVHDGEPVHAVLFSCREEADRPGFPILLVYDDQLVVDAKLDPEDQVPMGLFPDEASVDALAFDVAGDRTSAVFSWEGAALYGGAHRATAQVGATVRFDLVGPVWGADFELSELVMHTPDGDSRLPAGAALVGLLTADSTLDGETGSRILSDGSRLPLGELSASCDFLPPVGSDGTVTLSTGKTVVPNLTDARTGDAICGIDAAAPPAGWEGFAADADSYAAYALIHGSPTGSAAPYRMVSEAAVLPAGSHD